MDSVEIQKTIDFLKEFKYNRYDIIEIEPSRNIDKKYELYIYKDHYMSDDNISIYFDDLAEVMEIIDTVSNIEAM